MESASFSGFTSRRPEMRSDCVGNVSLAEATLADPEPASVFPLTDEDVVVNLEEGVLSTVEQNIIKVATEEMYSDLLPDQDITTLIPMAASLSPERPGNWTSSPATSIDSGIMESSMYMPMALVSPATSSGYESSPEGILYSPMTAASSSSEESITLVVSPEDDLDEEVRPNRKRGQKPKLKTVLCTPPRPKKGKKMTAASSSSKESITLVVGLKDIEQLHPKRKRGQKPKLKTGTSVLPRTRKGRKRTAASSSPKESITLVVSLKDVKQVRPRRKREEKPKLETCTPPRPKKGKKMKVYEIDHPLEDEEKEKKRLNAINAKRHRDLQKQNKESLEKQLEDVKNERDVLKREIEILREKEVKLNQQLEVFKKHFGKQALAVMSLLQTGQLSF